MNVNPLSGPVLAVHPTASGFGWALFDEAGMLLDWGMASANEGRKLRLVNRFKRLLGRHEPAVLVIETYQDRRQADRIRSLYRAFARVASGIGAQTFAYDRDDVATALELTNSATRHDVTLAVATRLPELSHRMPRQQRFGAASDARQSLFAAAALGLAHLTARGVRPPVHPGAPE